MYFGELTDVENVRHKEKNQGGASSVAQGGRRWWRQGALRWECTTL